MKLDLELKLKLFLIDRRMERLKYKNRVTLFRSLLAAPSNQPTSVSFQAAPSETKAEPVSSNLFLPRGDTIDLVYLRKLCLDGIPDEFGIRPTCWKYEPY